MAVLIVLQCNTPFPLLLIGFRRGSAAVIYFTTDSVAVAVGDYRLG